MPPHILTIAGSDPSGGAGIQADLKTVGALGGYGMSVITALTAQNTVGVQDIFHVPTDFIRSQIESLFSDIRIDAVKIGMLGTAACADAVSMALQTYTGPIVLDPVLVSTSGDSLSSDELQKTLTSCLLPLVTLITPNIPEAEALLGKPVNDLKSAAHDLLGLGAKAVLLKGGHANGNIVRDILCTPEETFIFESPRIHTENTHGTGCTLSSAVAYFLGSGLPLSTAVEKARSYLMKALEHADDLDIGKGKGPVSHFWNNASA